MTIRMSAAAGAEVDGVSLDTITELDTKIQSLEQVHKELMTLTFPQALIQLILEHKSPDPGATRGG